MATLVAVALTLFTIADEGLPSFAQDPPSQESYRFETVWRPLAQCESSQRWHIRGRTYSGGLQMDATFWRRYGGREFAPSPDQASVDEQVAVAERGLEVQGWGAWPYCSRHLGFR